MGKIAAFAGPGGGYAQIDIPADEPDVWVTVRTQFDPTALTHFTSFGSGNFAAIYSAGGADFLDAININDDSGPKWFSFVGSGPTPTPTPDEWHVCELHYVNGVSSDLYVDGVLVVSGVTGSVDARRFQFGGLFAYLDDVKIGTARGGSDLFADDFEDGTFDAWDVLINEENLSIIDDPFIDHPDIPEGRFVVALDDDPMTANPGWERMDDVLRVQAWSSSAGRSTELDRVQPGTATVTLKDTDGRLDPTNPFSGYTGRLVPGKQAGLLLQNPITEEWSFRFRGYIDDIVVTMDTTARTSTVEISLTDLLGRLSGVEMAPPLYGQPPPAGSEGDIWFPFTTTDRQVAERMDEMAADLNVPPLLQRFFTGNVQLQSQVYSHGEQALTVFYEASDAEFPGVATFFNSKDGILTFHGRLARFHPEDYAATDDASRTHGNSICFWAAGSKDVADEHADVAPIVALEFGLSANDVINDALALPKGIEDGDIEGLHVEDTESKQAYGVRSVSFENLLMLSGDSDPISEADHAHEIAQYYVDNYSTPRVRIRRLEFVSRDPDSFSGEALWALLCGVDISDVVTVTTHHFPNEAHPEGQSGFAEDYFVERVQVDCEPGPAGYDIVRMVLDVSPRAFYDVEPWAA